MKKTLRFLSMAALVLMGLATIGCTSSELVNEQPVNIDKKVTLTTTVSLDVATKALTATGVKTFKAEETMAIVYKNTSGNTVKAVSAALTEGDISGTGENLNKTATFTFTLDDPDRTQNVIYIYPAAMAKGDGTVNYDDLYTKQDGSLATLGSTFDYCTNSGAWNEGKLPSLTLENQLSILAITLKNSDGSSTITGGLNSVTISDGTNTYEVAKSGTFGGDVIYVAILPVTTSTALKIEATDGGNNYVKTLASRTYEANNGYNVSWKMAVKTAADVTAKDLLKLIGANGKIYTTTAAVEAAGTTVLAKILYVGEAGSADASSSTYKGLALTLEDVKTDADANPTWCSQSNATCLATQYKGKSFGSGDPVTTDMHGIANTNALIASSHTHEAATVARNYNGGNHPEGTSAWFLPSAGQWKKMEDAMGTGAKLKTEAKLENSTYYTSTEETKAWVCHYFVGTPGQFTDSHKSYKQRVRACLAF